MYLLVSSWFMAARSFRHSVSVSIALLAFLLLCAAARAQVDIDKLPNPTSYVNDFAHVVDPASQAQLEEFCTKVERQLGVQFAFVTVDSVGDRPIRDVGLDIARKWGVGPSKDNGGVLLLLAIKDRKSDLEIGRGVEPYVTDGFSGSTLRAIRPQLQGGDYGPALLTAARAMAAQIAQGKGIPFSDAALPQRRPQEGQNRRGIPFPLILLGIFFLIWLFGRGGRGGYRGGGYGGGGGGFLTGMILGNMLGGGRRGGYGGDWGGGGFGGGDSGGGGFGGFGGGDFGGGGASSNW
jgi:uncharacterized protein